ncbi:hypothetical protein PR048_001051 [Dryococelus australis]|uniref:Uncharacterized protein n=1 Tax=Dryococelus australis TaxID=614101 RepID=A0ABQ9IG96_9NEOP|nr:hypothetical protein PR048_001051 [Dryococelus australis]
MYRSMENAYPLHTSSRRLHYQGHTGSRQQPAIPSAVPRNIRVQLPKTSTPEPDDSLMLPPDVSFVSSPTVGRTNHQLRIPRSQLMTHSSQRHTRSPPRPTSPTNYVDELVIFPEVVEGLIRFYADWDLSSMEQRERFFMLRKLDKFHTERRRMVSDILREDPRLQQDRNVKLLRNIGFSTFELVSPEEFQQQMMMM